jgi:hypothetical protein
MPSTHRFPLLTKPLRPWLGCLAGCALAASLFGAPAASAVPAPADAPIRFSANGTLVSLRAGEQELLKEGAQPNGFFALIFDGTRVKEVPLPNVAVAGDRLRVSGQNQFPRLEFTWAVTQGRISLGLVRAEGLPRGRDVSILFRAALRTPYTVKSDAPCLAVDEKSGVARAFWNSLPPAGPGAAFGTVTLTAKSK